MEYLLSPRSEKQVRYWFMWLRNGRSWLARNQPFSVRKRTHDVWPAQPMKSPLLQLAWMKKMQWGSKWFFKPSNQTVHDSGHPTLACGLRNSSEKRLHHRRNQGRAQESIRPTRLEGVGNIIYVQGRGEPALWFHPAWYYHYHPMLRLMPAVPVSQAYYGPWNFLEATSSVHFINVDGP